MVLYFTGTGNSRYIASRIAEALNDELFSINDRLKSGDTSPVATGEALILVTPTYAWRIPRIVQDWLLKTSFPAAKRVWFIMDCGSEIGNAAKFNRKLCQAKDLAYMGTAQILMPENYIALRQRKRVPSSPRPSRTFAAPLPALQPHSPFRRRAAVSMTVWQAPR